MTHPTTGLAVAQPTDCLVTDEDLVVLARAEAMYLAHLEAERVRAAIAAAGLEHDYARERLAC